MPRKRRNATCHPDRPHFALGLCKQCYPREHRRRNIETIREKDNERYWRDREKRIAYQVERHARKRQEDVEGVRWRDRIDKLRRRSGITLSLDEYLELIEAQGGKCPICGVSFADVGVKIVIDHDHGDNFVRGILCRRCNAGLGLLGDDLETVIRAAEYLHDAEDVVARLRG